MFSLNSFCTFFLHSADGKKIGLSSLIWILAVHRQGSHHGELLTAPKISPALHRGINHVAATSALGPEGRPSLGMGPRCRRLRTPVPFRAAHWPGHHQTWLPCATALLMGPDLSCFSLMEEQRCADGHWNHVGSWELYSVRRPSTKPLKINGDSWTGFKSKQFDSSPHSSPQSQRQTSKWVFYNKPKVACDMI